MFGHGSIVGSSTHHELMQWKAAGLIDFDDSTEIDQVVADLLAVLREHVIHPVRVFNPYDDDDHLDE